MAGALQGRLVCLLLPRPCYFKRKREGTVSEDMEQNRKIYDKNGVGNRIRRRRQSLGISRRKMAEQIGKAEKYYADIERGYCGMSLETMIQIAGCLGITLDYLVFGEQQEGELPEETKSILFYLKNCNEEKRKKASELLQVYLSE